MGAFAISLMLFLIISFVSYAIVIYAPRLRRVEKKLITRGRLKEIIVIHAGLDSGLPSGKVRFRGKSVQVAIINGYHLNSRDVVKGYFLPGEKHALIKTRGIEDKVNKNSNRGLIIFFQIFWVLSFIITLTLLVRAEK